MTVYVATAGLILFLILLIAFNVRTNNWRNRRKTQRRKVADRRVNLGRRKQNSSEYQNEFSNRRKQGDRRVGPPTRRRRKRRAEDRLGSV